MSTSFTLRTERPRKTGGDLSALRPSQVSFGDFSTTMRGETRNQGYAQDWVRSGATATGDDIVGAGTTFINQYNGGDPAGALVC